MDRLIYTAMTGATAATDRQAVLANNLANASTAGFRGELSTFRAVPIRGDGATTRVFAAQATAGYDPKQGLIQHTDRNLDAAAQGNAWFAVQGLDGTEAYTRAGSFQVNSDGTLVNPSGLPVLSDGGSPIDVPQGAHITLGNDGTLTSKVEGQPPATVGRLKLVTPTPDDPIQRSDDGLFRSPTQNPLASDTTARLQTGAIEGSNVNPIEAMVSMIQAARQFDSQTRLMQSAETNDKSAAQLLSVN